MSPAAPACPHCGRSAPLVYRGVVPYCTACGALRFPLSGPSLNMAGQPARIGGTVWSAVGALVLLVGGSMALGLGLLLAAHTLLLVTIVLPLAIASLAVGIFSLRRGVLSRRHGADIARLRREQALLALAAHRGAVTAADAAALLGLEGDAADATLTDLAKQQPERLSVEVDDQGVVWYCSADRRVRVEPASAAANVRVDQGEPRFRAPVEGPTHDGRDARDEIEGTHEGETNRVEQGRFAAFEGEGRGAWRSRRGSSGGGGDA